jgi:hypothetical protein
MGPKSESGEWKIFPFVGRENLFYLLYRSGVLLSVTLRGE